MFHSCNKSCYHINSKEKCIYSDTVFKIFLRGGHVVKNLKKLRKLFGVSQQQLADVIGVSQQSINKYENHNIEPDIETLIAMADYFNTSVDYLIGRTPQQNDDEEAEAFLRTIHKMSKKQKTAYLDIGKTLLHYDEDK